LKDGSALGPEWLYEAGIGEARAALVEGDTILAARIEPDDAGPRLDSVAPARLIEKATGLVRLEDGAEALLTRTAAVTQGATLTVRIVREAIPEPGGRRKPVRAVPTDEPQRPGPDLLARLQADAIPLAPPRRRPGPSRDEADDEGKSLKTTQPEAGPRPPPGKRDEESYPIRILTPHGPDLLEAAGWSELLEEARTGDIAFPGGSLRMWPNPAMTLFDVDGGGPLEPLAIAAAGAVARAIRRHGVGGSIGIDFPTLAGKAARQAVADALDAALGWDTGYERTAMNGFGFLQIVRPRLRPSLPERLATDRAGAEARALLRRLEREPPGSPTDHRVAPPVLARLQSRPDWLAELARRTGRTHTFNPSP
jgi:ribonuclease G